MKKIKTILMILVLFAVTKPAAAQQEVFNKAINHVTECYLGVKRNLEANDGIAAENKAKELLQALNDAQTKMMTPEQAKEWAKYIDPLKFDSRHISEVPRVAHQKEHFARLSKNMHALLNGLKMNKAGI